MYNSSIKQHWLEYTLIVVWICNCIIAWIISIREVWVPYMSAWSDSYTHIRSLPFDGTVMPLSYIPDWTKQSNQDKSKRFEDIAISDYIPLPSYDATSLAQDLNNTTKMSTILHFTYTVPYMWSYRFNYKENDGSHLGVDIRAPIGTPILSIANWVVVRTVEADGVWNKFVVIRHDDVPLNGTKVSLYSGYLHLSQITVTEGTKIKKWEMLGRVGMTGIATTPHLHFQIDTMDAPFHPYWPFTSSEAKNAGFGFLEAISAWLGKENALKYTIHPMNFINTHLGWVYTDSFSSAPIVLTQKQTQSIIIENEEDISTREREILLWSYQSTTSQACDKKRFSDVSESGKFGKSLYQLVDNNCLFQINWNFNPNNSVTLREWVIEIMKYYNIKPVAGTSHFLDIWINDELQWYALVLYRKWLIDGNYFSPGKILTKAETIDLIVKIGWLWNNPWQIRIYSDADSMHPYFRSIQSYGFAIRARGWKIYPNNLLTRADLVGLIYTISKLKK